VEKGKVSESFGVAGSRAVQRGRHPDVSKDRSNYIFKGCDVF